MWEGNLSTLRTWTSQCQIRQIELELCVTLCTGWKPLQHYLLTHHCVQSLKSLFCPFPFLWFVVWEISCQCLCPPTEIKQLCDPQQFILIIVNVAIELFSSSFFIIKSFNLCRQGHSSYITHLDWSPDNKFIMSNSGDYEILYCKWLTATSSLFGSVSLKNIHVRSYLTFCLFGWVQSTMTVSVCGLWLHLDQRLLKCCVFLTCCSPSSTGDIPNGCKLIRNRSECKDIDWATYTCVLGFHVFGQYLWSDALRDFVQ